MIRKRYRSGAFQQPNVSRIRTQEGVMCAGGLRAGGRLVAGVARIEPAHGRRLLVAGSAAFAPLRMEAARDLRWRVMRCFAPCARRCVLRAFSSNENDLKCRANTTTVQ